MKELFRYLRGERLKMKHTILPGFHAAVPLLGILLFLLYYRGTAYSRQSELSGYIMVLTTAFPLIISIVCVLSVSMEEKNHFQVFLGTAVKKRNAFLAKWFILSGMGLGAVILAVFGFMAGYSFILGKDKFDFGLCSAVSVCMWLCGQGQYVIHLYLNLSGGKSISMCAGAAESLVSALMLTGLGDGIWPFLPCAFGGRWEDCLLKGWFAGRANAKPLYPYYGRILLINIVVMAGIIGLSAVWFYFYEGRRVDD